MATQKKKCPQGQQRCTVCKQCKRPSEFNKRSAMTNNRRSECRSCQATARKQAYAKTGR